MEAGLAMVGHYFHIKFDKIAKTKLSCGCVIKEQNLIQPYKPI